MTQRVLCSGAHVCWLLILLSLLPQTAGAVIAQIGTEKFDFSFPSEKTATITSETVTIKPNESIKGLLRGNQIKPDAEALALVKRLNPGLDTLDDLQPKTQIILPQVEAEAGAPPTPVEITVDPELRERLANNVKALSSLLAEVEALDDSRFEGGSKDTTTEMIEDLS